MSNILKLKRPQSANFPQIFPPRTRGATARLAFFRPPTRPQPMELLRAFRQGARGAKARATF
eukprot:1642456-Pyramimonas_sp.AAC.1